MTRIIPPLSPKDDKSLPSWLKTEELFTLGKSKDQSTNETIGQKIIVDYQCLACKKSYPVDNAAIKTQSSASKLMGKKVFEPVCPNCTSVLTEGKVVIRPDIKSDSRVGDLIEKRGSLEKNSSQGTYNTYMDQHVIYKTLNALQRHCVKQGMINPEVKYIHSEHQTMTGQDYPSLNNITCKIEWLYGRKQKARVYAGVSVDQSGKVILPQTFMTSDKTQLPFTKESIKELERYAEGPKMMKQELKATDIPIFKRPDISRFRSVQSSKSPVFGKDKTEIKKNAYDTMLTPQPAQQPVQQPLPGNSINNANPSQPYQPGAQLTNPTDGQIYTVKEQQPGVGIIATDPSGLEVTIPEANIVNMRPVVQTTSSFTTESLAEALVKKHLEGDIRGMQEGEEQLGEEIQEDKELIDKLTNTSLNKKAGVEDFFRSLKTYRGSDEKYEVYFADSYIELIDPATGRFVQQYPYPEQGETVSVLGAEGDEAVSEGLYFSDEGYLEFIKDDRVLTTFYFNEVIEVKDDLEKGKSLDGYVDDSIIDEGIDVEGSKQLQPHVKTMSRRWKEIREELRQKQARKMQEDLVNTPVEKLSRQQLALREKLGYTPTKENVVDDSGRDPVTGLPVGETGQRDFIASPEFESEYDRPFEKAEEDFEDNQPRFNRDHEKARDMNRKEMRELHKEQKPDPMTMNLKPGEGESFSSSVLKEMIGVSKVSADEEKKVVEKPIQYKEQKKAPKVEEFEEPAVIPMAAEKVKEAITKFKKVQAEIRGVETELAEKIKPIKQRLADESKPFQEDLKVKGDLLLSYLSMLYDQIRKTSESVVAYEDFIIAAVSRDVEEKGSTVTVPQLIAKLEELTPEIADKVKEARKIIEDERATQVIQRIIFEYPQSQVQKKKIETSMDSLKDVLQAISKLINDFTELNNHLVLPS